MATVVMQEFNGSQPWGMPDFYQGNSFDEVTEKLMSELVEYFDVPFVVSVMFKWFGGKTFAESIGAFSVREYDGPVGCWFEFTYHA